jgi:hypothetical protein
MKEIKSKTAAARKAEQLEKKKAIAIKKAARRERLKAAVTKRNERAAKKAAKVKGVKLKKAAHLERLKAAVAKRNERAAKKAPRAAKRAKKMSLKDAAALPLQLNAGERILEFDDGDSPTFVGDYVGRKCE